ncbi:hypothetical protein HNQ94_001215 [Salirhabdus euzebyi]|uniref:DUF1643 domain-containing protein n=1 Tax=Salirhabdus euzebyi TaxID=394506 RepID=A0A841PV62_9BACI|nr:DUF1643 domain-containing protein [Salirhabdus euzebyi]MBB6452769.1 hypothetical protein [Salirhabdus euzebyi]
MAHVYFSSYVDEENIVVNPTNNIENNSICHRFSLTIPFKQRPNGGNVLVFMKNPSDAGKEYHKKKISDDTLYKVLDYLYKAEQRFSKVIILNLFTIVNGTASNIKEYIGSDEELIFREKNNNLIEEHLSQYNEANDEIIAAWGSYNGILESKYNKRIKEVLKIIGDRPLKIVGKTVNNGKYPGHGKWWYDYEPILPYPSTAISYNKFKGS